MPPTHILCPTDAERGALARVLGVKKKSLGLCGVGPAGIAGFAVKAAADIPKGGMVVVAGVAGALHSSISLHEARWIGEIVYGKRRVRTAENPLRGNLAAVASVDAICSGEAAKSALHRETGAVLVDMESGPLACLAAERGWSLRVARAVSDDPGDELPEWLMHMLNTDGTTRLAGLPNLLAALPASAVDLILIRRRLHACMENIGMLLKADGLVG